jgi:hypothetical protein
MSQNQIAKQLEKIQAENNIIFTYSVNTEANSIFISNLTCFEKGENGEIVILTAFADQLLNIITNSDYYVFSDDCSNVTFDY